MTRRQIDDLVARYKNHVPAIRSAAADDFVDSPSFGFAFAAHLAVSAEPKPFLRSKAYRWIRVAILAIRRSKPHFIYPNHADVEAVREAYVLFECQEFRAVLNGLLMAGDADIPRIAKLMQRTVKVVRAYAALFFNVMDRRDECSYIDRVVMQGDHLSAGARSAPPRGKSERFLLAIGRGGTMEDVYFAAGYQVLKGRQAQLHKRFLNHVGKFNLEHPQNGRMALEEKINRAMNPTTRR
jgi:hypothetical protein